MQQGMTNIHKWIAASVHSYFYKLNRTKIFVKYITIDTLPTVSGDLNDKDAAGLFVIGGIEYTCMSVARRVALYAGMVQNIYNKEAYNEFRNEELFYQNYVQYSYHIYRMLEWMLRTAFFWQDIPISELWGSLGKQRMPIAYDRMWPLVLPPSAFCINQYSFTALASEIWKNRLTVDLIPENAYFQIEFPHSSLCTCKKTDYFFHGDGEVFRPTMQSTCSVSSKFCF